MGGFGIGDTPDIEGDGPKPGEPPARPANDFDADGLTDDFERTGTGTDWRKADTDGDGISDRAEVEGPGDPLVADTDGDGINDGDELKYGTDPENKDTDGDGLDDYDDTLVLQPTYYTGPSPFGSPPISPEEAAFRAQAGKGVDPTQVLPGSTTGAGGGFVQMFPTSASAAPDAAAAALAPAEGEAGATEDGAPDGTAIDGHDAQDGHEFDIDARISDFDLRFGAGRGADAGELSDLDGGALRSEVLSRINERIGPEDGPRHETDDVDVDAGTWTDAADDGDDDAEVEPDDGPDLQGIKAPEPGEENADFVY